MRLNPDTIQPTQDFLRPKTVEFIFDCIARNREDLLPPSPIVRQDPDGSYVAIDGHNLLSVRSFLKQEIEVHVATLPSDGLSDTSDENKQRNEDLLEKFESCLQDRDRVSDQGINSFSDLIAKYPDLFVGEKN